MGEYLRNQYMKSTTSNWKYDTKYLKMVKQNERQKQMEKFKKILTEIVKVGGWIIVALQNLLDVL